MALRPIPIGACRLLLGAALLGAASLGACGGAPPPLAPMPVPGDGEVRTRAIDETGQRIYAALARGAPTDLLVDDVGLRGLLDSQAATRFAALRVGISARLGGRRVASWVEGAFVYTREGFRALDLTRVEVPRWEHADLELAACDMEVGILNPRPVVVATD